jgi:hypothetical protein
MADTVAGMSIDQLKKRSDSLIENIGALRFSVARIELLDGYRALLRDLLADCRVIVAAHGHKTLLKKIDRAMTETEDTTQ